MQQEILLSMVKYGSVGAIELVSDTGELCDVRAVLSRIMAAGQESPRPGHGLVIIWGRIYEENSQLYVQSYIRFLRRGEPETIEVTPKELGEGAPRFNAPLPAQALEMVPRGLSKRDLEGIEENASKVLVMRTGPSDTAKPVPLMKHPDEALMYGVEKVEGVWIKIRDQITNQPGWVRARNDDEAQALRRFLPELGYLDGVIAYLRLRTASRVPLSDDPKDIYGWMQRAFSDYEKAVGKDAAPDAAGLAKAMMGVALWTHPELAGDPDGRRRAANFFQEALDLMPDSPGARVLATVTASLLASGPPEKKTVFTDIDRGLLGAIAIEPRNASALGNLEQLYEFARSNRAVSSYGGKELESRLAVVRAARAGVGVR